MASKLHRLFQIGLLPILLIANVGQNGAWDADVLQDLDVRQRLAEQRALEDAMRQRLWDEVTRTCNLPSPVEASNICIFRVVNKAPPRAVRFHWPGDADPLDDCVSSIDRSWADLTPTDGRNIGWRLYPVDPSTRFSSSFSQDERYFILMSHEEERNTQTGKVNVIVEIDRYHMGHTFSMVYARPLEQKQNRVRLIRNIGYLCACTQTHQCRTWINGWPADDEEISLQVGDYVLLIMRPMQVRPLNLLVPTQDASSPMVQDGVENNDYESSGTSAASDSDVDSDAGDHLLSIYRPDFGHGHKLAHRFAGHITYVSAKQAALQAWPDLDEFDLFLVHPSFYFDFRFEPEMMCVVAVSQQDFPPNTQLRGVMVHLRVHGRRDTKSAPLARQTSAFGMLAWARLLDQCHYSRNLQCWVFHNQQLVRGSETVLLNHGDYIRIEAWSSGEEESDAAFLVLNEPNGDAEDPEAFWPPLPRPRRRGSAPSTQVSSTTQLCEGYDWMCKTACVWTVAFLFFICCAGNHSVRQRQNCGQFVAILELQGPHERNVL